MGVTRKLLEISDRKLKEALVENKSSIAFLSRAFLSGAIEGFMDAAVVMYVPVCAAVWIAVIKNAKKEK